MYRCRRALVDACPENVEVYNLICDSLSITPAANNGTLRLPLKPIGLHPNNSDGLVTTPNDPPLPSTEPPSSDSKDHSIGVDDPDVVPSRPVIDDEGGNGTSKIEQLWSSVISKLKGIKEWFRGSTSAGGDEKTEVANKTA